jgi:hypothetical protein
VPRNWVERSVKFMANNRYAGWQQADMTTQRWLDFNTYTGQSLLTFLGLGPHPYPPPPRTIVEMGGEQTPAEPAARSVTVTSWFRL